MSEENKCSASNCPQTDTNEPVSCHTCKIKLHLSCADIIQTPKKIFVAKNIVFICNSCIDSGPSSPKRKTSLSQSTLHSAGGVFSLQKSISSPSLVDRKTKKITPDEIKEIKEIKEMVKSLSVDLKQNTSTLAELKTNVGTMHETIHTNNTAVSSLESTVKLVEKNAASYASVAGQNNRPIKNQREKVSSNETTTTTNVNKPNAVQQTRTIDMETKLAIKGRKLTAGACKATSNCLGSAIKPKNAPNLKPERVLLPKSIYVSRLETTVKSDDVVNHIKQQIPDLNLKHVSAHMLVVKDKSLDELTFISFRLRCTDELFDQLRSPDFWPEHVLIGDFVEKPHKVQLGDFIAHKIDASTNSNVPDNPMATTSAQLGSAPVQSQSKNDLLQTDLAAVDQSIEMIEADK